LLARAAKTGAVRLWDVEKKKEWQTIRAGKERLTALARRGRRHVDDRRRL
jgi:hypothetical protein